jgi:hypothetical protein
MAIPVAVFFGLYSEEVMQLWLGAVLGPADIHIASQVLAGWALIELAVSLEGSAWAVLFGMRKVQFVIWIEVFAAILNIGASIWLIQVTDWGVLAVVLPSIVLEGLIRPIYALYAAQQAKLAASIVLSQVYLRPTLVGIGLAASTLGMRALLPSDGWFWLTLHGSLIGLIFLLLSIFLGITHTERQRIIGMLKSRLGKRG